MTRIEISVGSSAYCLRLPVSGAYTLYLKLSNPIPCNVTANG